MASEQGQEVGVADKRPELCLSYLLRLWRTGHGGQEVWRASLDDIANGVRTGFADPDVLFAYRREQMTLRCANQEDQEDTAESAPS